MKKITELVYYSISNIEATSKNMADILVQSRQLNSKKNITGCLLYHDKIFLQLLEGEKEVIKNLFKTIKKDKRHSNVTLIMEEELEERMFPSWSMAFHELNSNEAEVNQFIENIDFISKNNDKKTDAMNIFFNMAKQIVVK